VTTLNELLALFPDNDTGDIGADDLRTAVTELWSAAYEYYTPGPWTNLPAAAAFRSLPAPFSFDVTFESQRRVLVSLDAYFDSAVVNNAISFGLTLSGATAVPAGGGNQTIRLGGKQPVSSTVSTCFIQVFEQGVTTVEAMYKASAGGATISDITITAVGFAT
jgi:hypothetical protein